LSKNTLARRDTERKQKQRRGKISGRPAYERKYKRDRREIPTKLIALQDLQLTIVHTEVEN